MDYDEKQLVADLKALLARRKKSLRSLSGEIGVPYRSMQNYFSGDTTMPAMVLIKVLDSLGSDIKYLRTGDNLLRHADIYDAVWHVFGDALLDINNNRLGKQKTDWQVDMEEFHRKQNTAAALSQKISEAYDRFTQNHMTWLPGPTIKDIINRRQKPASEAVADGTHDEPDAE